MHEAPKTLLDHGYFMSKIKKKSKPDTQYYKKAEEEKEEMCLPWGELGRKKKQFRPTDEI